MALLRITEAARMIGVHVSTLRRWTNAGTIPHYRTPGEQRRFDEDELSKWLHDRKCSPNGHKEEQ